MEEYLAWLDVLLLEYLVWDGLDNQPDPAVDDRSNADEIAAESKVQPDYSSGR